MLSAAIQLSVQQQQEMHGKSKQLGPAAAEFGQCKMPNCGVCMCEFDFSEGVSPAACMTSIKLIFGKELHHRGYVDNEGRGSMVAVV